MGHGVMGGGGGLYERLFSLGPLLDDHIHLRVSIYRITRKVETLVRADRHLE